MKESSLENSLSPNEIYDLLKSAALASEAEDYQRAESLYKIIRSQLPTIASIASNHGNILLKLGRGPEAIIAYRAAVAADPAGIGYIQNLAGALLDSHAYDEAIALLRHALSIDPANTGLLASLADGLAKTENFEEAALYLHKVLAIKPDHPDAWCSLANILLKQGKASEARSAYMQAITLQPRPEFHSNLSNALVQLGEFDQAIEVLQKAIALNPQFAAARSNLGNVFARIGRLEESIEAYRDAIRLDPDFAVAWCDLGHVYLQMGLSTQALEAFNQAVAIDPDYSDAQLYRALTLLRFGHSEEGWQAYEWRWKTYRQVNLTMPADTLPRWNGEPLTGKHILVWQEQGYGDTIQFSRYAADLAALGAKVSFLVDKSLAALMQSVPGISAVFTDADAKYEADFQVPLMSLPGLLRREFGASDASILYVFADPALSAVWRERLAGLRKFRVGLVWAGDPRPHDPAAHQMDLRRSLTLADLAPLSQVEGIDFVSLQKGVAAQQADSSTFGAPILNVSDDLRSFSDTAAVIDNLDLVISVDTSVAHLAGAMGKPVWILSRLGGCWRWLEGRDDTPWYPRARLFRQTSLGDWANVVSRAAEALRPLGNQLDAAR